MRVLRKGDLAVFGGPIALWRHAKPGAIVDLTGKMRPVVQVYGDPELDFGEPLIISIRWNDFDVPDLDRAFWEKLAAYMLKRGGRWYVGCDLGVGRTGTALAILGHLIEGWGKPIREVRARLHPEAVETLDQALYVASITGILEEDEAMQTYFFMPKDVNRLTSHQDGSMLEAEVDDAEGRDH